MSEGVSDLAPRAEDARQGGAGSARATTGGIVIGLLGPTGVGKTAVAFALATLLAREWPRPPGAAGPAAKYDAEETGSEGGRAGADHALGGRAGGSGADESGTAESGAERARIISCDSMQVYRGFPVLTNQPSGLSTEQDAHGEVPDREPRAAAEAVPHAAVGFVDPDVEFSAAAYADYVRALIEQDLSLRGWALIAGGSGLYMRAALAPLAVVGGGTPELRARLEARASEEGLATMYGELARLDPEAAKKIDPRNSRRILRALEAITLTGGQWSGRDDLWSPSYYYPTLLVGLVASREELYRRIDDRAGRMLREGAVEEVGRFRETRGSEATQPGGPGIRSAIGYPEICRFLDGEETLEETVTQVAAATRRYARRQLTWLRKVRDAVIIDIQDREPFDVAGQILELARSGDRTRGAHRS